MCNKAYRTTSKEETQKLIIGTKLSAGIGLNPEDKKEICEYIGDHHFKQFYECLDPMYCPNQERQGGFTFCNGKKALEDKL